MSTRKRRVIVTEDLLDYENPLIKFRMQLISTLVLMHNFFNKFSVHYQSYTGVSYVTIVQTSAGSSYDDYQVATFPRAAEGV